MSDVVAKKARFAWLLPLAALAIGYAAGRHHRGPAMDMGQSTRAADEGEPAEAASARSNALRLIVRQPSGPSPRTTSALPPVPIASTPLARAFDALAVRARAGDASAAARLLDETSHCRERTRELGLLASPAPAPDARISEHVRRTMAREREAARNDVDATAALCEDVTPAELATAGEWLERAADGGDAGAGLCYALLATSDEFIPPRYSDEWIDWMRHYRANALADAERALDAGSLQAVDFLGALYAGSHSGPAYGGQSPLSAEVSPDYTRAYMLTLVELRHVREENDPDPGRLETLEFRARELESMLGTEALARARRDADTESARLAARPDLTPPCHGVPAL